MADIDMLAISMAANTITQSMSGVEHLLAEGSRCHLAASRRGARKAALRQALLTRDRLESLIVGLGGRAMSADNALSGAAPPVLAAPTITEAREALAEARRALRIGFVDSALDRLAAFIDAQNATLAALRDLLDNPHDNAARIRAAKVLAEIEGRQP